MKIFKNNIFYIIGSILFITVAISLLPTSLNTEDIIVLGGILFIFAFGFSYLIEKKIVTASEKISDFIVSISNQEFGKKLDPASYYFDSRLPKLLNEHSKKLEEIFERLKREKSELETVLSTMNEGVILISENNTVNLVNKAAIKMFKLEDQKNLNRPYWELIRNKDLNDAISSVTKRKEPLTTEISILHPEERFYKVSINPVNKISSAIVMVLSDITEFKKVEKIKADFIANASHELRTPLTSIKGYVETLQDGAYSNEKQRKQFLDIINKNTERVINIVSDLLTISELEGKESLTYKSQTITNELEPINIHQIIQDSFMSFKNKIEEKQIDHKVEIQNPLPLCMGNKFLLEQMISNLLDNAIKYTPSGGKISVRTYSINNIINKEVIIEVSDTGIGIPSEEKERIFERFYRVDKDRSRQMGGTGLGLSIVKHIVLLHGGKIEVKSELGKGSTFTVKLPAKD